MDQYVVAQDAAEADFDRFIEMMDIDANARTDDESDRRSFERLRYTLVRSIMRGDLAINEKGEPVFTPRVPIPGLSGAITLREPTGATLRAASSKKDEQEKTQAILAAMSGLQPVIFAKMAVRDFKVCATVVTAFLA